MTPRRTAVGDADGLDERLSATSDPGTGLALILRRALADSDLPCGVVAYRHQEGYRVLDAGDAGALVRGVEGAIDRDDSPLVQAFAAGIRGRVPLATDHGDAVAVVPLPVEGDAAWAHVVVPASTDPDRLHILRDVFTAFMPQLGRIRLARRLMGRAAPRSLPRDLFSDLVRGFPDPVLVSTPGNGIVLANEPAERLIDASGPNRSRLVALLSDLRLRHGDRRAERLDLEDPDSGERWPVEVVSSPILEDGGEVVAVLSVLHDRRPVEELEDRLRLVTTELAESNRRLEWQSRELAQAARLKSEFLASMSHELRTPINAVLGYTSLMREEIYGELTRRQRDGLDKVNRASQHLLELVNDILDLSKIEAGRLPVSLEEVALPDVLRELADSVEPLVLDKGLELRVHAHPELPTLFTDRTRLKQILLNLLSNAIKFTADGHVAVEAHPVGRTHVRITVHDTGIGIRRDDLDTIFDDFRQVDQSPTREFGGTGLGLSITRKLVALLEGVIEVQSEHGAGSRFTVELPVRLQRHTPGV